jgi:ubiquitin-protein ligase
MAAIARIARARILQRAIQNCCPPTTPSSSNDHRHLSKPSFLRLTKNRASNFSSPGNTAETSTSSYTSPLSLLFAPPSGFPSLPDSPPRVLFSTASFLQEEREQALRDYKVTIEYKHLKSHAPGGVYLVPSLTNLRHFFGLIFIRRGPFTNGIFKFQLKLPKEYNDTDKWPTIVFDSHVYNPYVNEETRELDIKTAYPTWDPSRHVSFAEAVSLLWLSSFLPNLLLTLNVAVCCFIHQYLVTVLTFLKKIFYSKNFADAKANPAAKELSENDPDAYRRKVEECVEESQKNVYINRAGSTARFSEEAVSHRVLRDLLKHHVKDEKQVTKQAVLDQVEKASKV